MDLFTWKDSKPRWASFENPTGERGAGGTANRGAKGHPCDTFFDGTKRVLCDVAGSGVIRRIWFTVDIRNEAVLSGTYIKAYWDGAEKPAVSAPIGEFFCMGKKKMRAFENALFSSPEGRSFNCIVPMPFKTGAKIVLENESGENIRMLFYDVDYTLEDVSADTMYFHAVYNETRMKLGDDHEIIPSVNGRGRFLGTNIYVAANPDYADSWWGEGEVKIYFDGEKNPTMVGTGTEDYIGTAWGQWEFCNMYQGCNDDKNGGSFYRLHIPDPIFFNGEFRVTIQRLGGAPKNVVQTYLDKKCNITITSDGKFLNLMDAENLDDFADGSFLIFFREDTFSSVAYLYHEDSFL